MSLEQGNITEETITPEEASAAVGDLPANGFANNEAREFFSEFRERHDSGLMELLQKAENFAVNEVAPLVERDLGTYVHKRVKLDF